MVPPVEVLSLPVVPVGCVLFLPIVAPAEALSPYAVPLPLLPLEYTIAVDADMQSSTLSVPKLQVSTCANE